MTTLTYAQSQKMAEKIQEYAPAKVTVAHQLNRAIVLLLIDEKDKYFRRIEINEAGQVTHIRVA